MMMLPSGLNDMKQTITYLTTALVLTAMTLLPGCSMYDDTPLQDRLDGLESRLDSLENIADNANLEINALREILSALENGVFIEDVEVADGSCTIYFSDGSSVTLTDGKDGLDAPVLSVALDPEDGYYYWTLGGSWLIADGKRVRADGTDGNDGADGVAPQLRINPDTYMWEISMDGGNTWEDTGVRAVGQGGAGEGILIRDVDISDENYVILVLNDGTEIRLPRAVIFEITGVGTEDVQDIVFGSTRHYKVKMAAVSGHAITCPDGWNAGLDIKDSTLSVTAPDRSDSFAEQDGEIAVLATSGAGAHKIVKIQVRAVEYEMRILTFEDEDYRGSGNYLGYKDWSSLIDTPQYDGPLLYPENADGEIYRWYDENNTFLASQLTNNYKDHKYWGGGGHVISDYVEMDLSKGDHLHQLSVYWKDPVTGYGGHNGSKNFCVHNGYRDNSGFTDNRALSSFYFKDGVARVVDHIYIMWSTYLANCVFNGNSLTAPLDPDGYVKVIAIGYDAEGKKVEHEPEYYLAGKGGNIQEWTKWDLSSLGKVSKIEFNMAGDSDNGYGFSQPAYFCYDDVAVRFELQ